jgi:hypothetical protein
MQIEIEGTRSSDDAWRKAYSISLDTLRELTAQEVAWTGPDDPAAEQIARKIYAIDLTLSELKAKCEKLGRLVSDWMKKSDLNGEVLLVRLRCLRGLFDVHVSEGGELHKLDVREDVLDDLLQGGSREALESLDRLFAANFGRLPVSKAS